MDLAQLLKKKFHVGSQMRTTSGESKKQSDLEGLKIK